MSVAGRQTHGVHGDLKLAIEVVGVGGVDGILNLAHLLHDRVDLVGRRLGHLVAEFLLSREQRAGAGDSLLDVAAHVGGLVEARLLRYETDAEVGRQTRGAEEVLVFLGHDAKQTALAGPVAADDADLRAG